MWHVPMDSRRVCGPLIVVVFLVCSCLITTSPTQTPHNATLQRGKTGLLKCPLVGRNAIAVEDVGSLYWYKEPLHGDELQLINIHEGEINLGARSPRGKYDIDAQLALVIHNVSDLDGSTYMCKVKPIDRSALQICTIDVAIVVPPSEPYPEVEECGRITHGHKDGHRHCWISLDPGETKYQLTARVANARPAVELQWGRILENGSLVDIGEHVVHEVRRVNDSHNETFGEDGGLFTSTAVLRGDYQKEVALLCSASGTAVGETTFNYMEVHVIQLPPRPQQTEESSTRTADKLPTSRPTAEESPTNGSNGDIRKSTGTHGICVLPVLLTAVAILAFVGVIVLAKKMYARRKEARAQDRSAKPDANGVKNGKILKEQAHPDETQVDMSFLDPSINELE